MMSCTTDETVHPGHAEGEERRGAMWKVTMRGLRSRRVRLFLSAIAVVLGVSFVTGVFVLGDTVSSSFDRVFTQTALDVDLVVRAADDARPDDDLRRERLSDEVVELVREVPGVAAADGVVQGIAKLQAPDGEIVQHALAPTIGISWPTQRDVGPLRLAGDASRPPSGPGEVAIDVATATRHGFAVGDEVGVQVGIRPVEPYRVVGWFRFGDAHELAGATFAAFDLAVAQAGFDAPGLVDAVNVRRDSGVSTMELRARLEAELGFGVEVVDAELVTEELADPLREGLGLLERLLLAFAAVGVFAGAFIIYNTFSILVSQRTRELGLLRSLGATNRQVLAAVLAEAALMGALAAAVGIVVGIGAARALLAGFSALGFVVPTGPTVVTARTVVAGALVGVGVTIVAALVPAIRAARVPPVVALSRELRTPSAPSVAHRGVLGALVGIGGLVVVAVGLRDDLATVEAEVITVALGCVAVFLGVVLAAPAVTRVVVPVLGTVTTATIAAVAGSVVAIGGLVVAAGSLVDDDPAAAVIPVLVAAGGAALMGAPPAMRGILGVLARGNALRNPRRTTATASALTLGVTLVFLVAIVAGSIRLSLQSGIEEGMRAEVVLSADQFAPISPMAVRTAAEVPTVDAVAQVKFGYAALAGGTELVTGLNADALGDVVDIDPIAGDPLGPAGGVFVSSVEARRLGLEVGDVLEVGLSRLGSMALPVTGIFENRSFTGSVLVDFLVDEATFDLGFGPTQAVTLAFLRSEPGTGAATRAEIEELIGSSYPDVRVQSVPEFQAEQDRAIDQIVHVLFALLALSLVLAVLGIVNTLLLSVFERTRELGLLRTVGMTQRQVRRMIRGEALVIAALGCGFGACLGLLWGWAFTTALEREGVSRLGLEPRPLLVFVVLAAAAGVLASVAPARRATRMDVLEAVAEE